VFDLCILVEIKADRYPPKSDLTWPVVICGRRCVWVFSTQFDQVSCRLGTNST